MHRNVQWLMMIVLLTEFKFEMLIGLKITKLYRFYFISLSSQCYSFILFIFRQLDDLFQVCRRKRKVFYQID